jgi:DNA-binding transcriptional LysR family regulator
MGQLEDLQAFIKIVEQQSIGKAAELEGIAKSAMSRRLRQLEDRLGVELITRTTRQWSLTPEGEAYYPKVQNALNALQDATSDISDNASEVKGDIRISLPRHYGRCVLFDLLTSYARAHPDIHLEIDFDDRQVDLVAERYDLAIRVANFNDSSLIARKIDQTRHIYVASPEYIVHSKPLKTPDDLKEHNILQSGHSHRFKWNVTQGGRDHSVTLKSALNSNDGDMLLAAAKAGLGIARLPDFLIAADLAQGALTPILAGYESAPLDVAIVYPATHHLPYRVRHFINYLVKAMKEQKTASECLGGFQK